MLVRGCVVLSIFFAINVVAYSQETFNYQLGGPNPSDWESSSNWSGGTGSFSNWPGEAPEAGTLDSANLGAAHAANYAIDISTPGLTLDVLTLGSSVSHVFTTITGSAGGTLTANQIRTASTSVSPHLINVDFVMPPVELDLPDSSTFAPTTFNGQFLNHAPIANTFRIVDNQSRRTLSVNGNVSLSNTATPGSLLFRNGGLPASTVMNGVIDDGSAPGGRMNYVRGLFIVTNANTYTGETIIGANDPEVETQVEIHNDLAFGTGRLTSGGGPALKTLRAIGGTRTLANEIRMARDLQYAGSNSFVLNGDIFQSNSRRLINDLIGVDKTVTINGDIYAADDNTPRPWTFAGTGKTIVNGSIYNTLSTGTPSASLVKTGTGTVELNAESFITGNTSVNAGTLLVNNVTGSGTGSGNVSVNDNAVLGGSGNVAGTVTVTSGGTLDPGNTVGLFTVGGLNLNSGGTLSIEIANTGVAGTDYDQVLVLDGATLAGSLSITLTNQVAPAVGDVFSILQSSTLSGSFSNVSSGSRLTTADGIGSFLVSYSDATNDVELSNFQATFSADFDRDGDVDNADLERWQLAYGVDDLADADGDGDSDGADFIAWQRQFGSAVTLTATVQAVPEPTAMLLLCCSVVPFISLRVSRANHPQSLAARNERVLHPRRVA